MSFDARLLRIPALLIAAAVLPCCSGDVGKGNTVRVVTIIGSETAAGVRGDGGSGQASFSADGLIMAFSSSATNLTPNDGNDLGDIFIKDRVTGIIENITNIPGSPTPGHSGYPSLSADGRYVGFLSFGRFGNSQAPGFTIDILRPYFYDRVTKNFVAVLAPGNQFMNNHTYDIALSADGRYMAFSTTSTNMQGINTQGQLQAYLCDFGPNRDTAVVTLISHASGNTALGSNGGGHINPGSISADGDLIVFDSSGTDILPADTDSGSDIYLYQRSTGILSVISIPSVANSTASLFCGISSDGTTVGYIYNDKALFPAPNYRNCQLYTIASGLRRTISDPALGAQGNTPVVLSGDGTRVVYGVGPFGQPQQYLYIEGQGNQLLVRSTDGLETTTLHTGLPAISADGRWTSWTTTANNLVSGDTNGVNDVFLRGPF
jgi:Tol biopolymer transport system component